MDKAHYIWEIWIPEKYVHRAYQALILMGKDINDEHQVSFMDYSPIYGDKRLHLFAEIQVVFLEGEERTFTDYLNSFQVPDFKGWIIDEFDGWIIDEFDEEEEN